MSVASFVCACTKIADYLCGWTVGAMESATCQGHVLLAFELGNVYCMLGWHSLFYYEL